MAKQALGIIETVGLAAGIEAADAAVKSAGVHLTGYELTKGAGMVLIKVEGDVGAVKAAIDAAYAAASKVGKVAAKQVIARPHDSLDTLIHSKETVGLQKKQLESPQHVESKQSVQVEEEASATSEKPELQAMEDESTAVKEQEKPALASDAELCNLCFDPTCPRRKGEPRQNCIHSKIEP